MVESLQGRLETRCPLSYHPHKVIAPCTRMDRKPVFNLYLVQLGRWKLYFHLWLSQSEKVLWRCCFMEMLWVYYIYIVCLRRVSLTLAVAGLVMNCFHLSFLIWIFNTNMMWILFYSFFKHVFVLLHMALLCANQLLVQDVTFDFNRYLNVFYICKWMAGLNRKTD